MKFRVKKLEEEFQRRVAEIKQSQSFTSNIFWSWKNILKKLPLRIRHQVSRLTQPLLYVHYTDRILAEVSVKLFKDSEKEKQKFPREAKRKQNIENKRKQVNLQVVIQISQQVEIENMFQQEITMNGRAKGIGSISHI